MSTTTTQAADVEIDRPYHHFLAQTITQFATLVGARDGGPLFHAVIPGANLWALYLAKIPEEVRQHHTCNACRHFVERFGNLVQVRADGSLSTPIWNEDFAPEELHDAVQAIRELLEGGMVDGQFIHSKTILGVPEAGGFRHLSLMMPPHLLNRSRVLSDDQAMAEKLEDYKTLQFALAEFKVPYLEDAVRILRADAVDRAGKFLEHAEWLLALKKRQLDRTIRDHRKISLLWLDVAKAPAGWCKPRAQMIGSLLEDLAVGMSFDQVKSRWNAKMAPLQYQRPQEPPKAGAILQAEKLVEQMGLAPAFARRFATLDDLETLWKPIPTKENAAPAPGLFSKVKPKGVAPRKELDVPPQTMTWAKFAKNVLPTAHGIELFVPVHANFTALLTAAFADAPPLIQWDKEDKRNPVSWYLYSGGSLSSRWGLSSSTWVEVPAIIDVPANWNGGKSSYEGVMLILDGAHDKTHKGSALFPEIIRSELHGVRAVIESYSKENDLIPNVGEPAAGLWIGTNTQKIHLRARGEDGAWMKYNIDRLD